MKEYDHNTKEHIEIRDFIAPFGYVLFNLTLLIGYLYISEPTPLHEPQPSFRSEVTTFKSNVQDSKIVPDTTYTIEKCIHVNPLTGTIDKFYGE